MHKKSTKQAAFMKDLGFGAKLTRFLLFVNLIPINVDKHYEKAMFSFTSRRTIFYLLMIYFPHIVAASIWFCQLDFFHDYFTTIIDMFSFFEIALGKPSKKKVWKFPYGGVGYPPPQEAWDLEYFQNWASEWEIFNFSRGKIVF